MAAASIQRLDRERRFHDGQARSRAQTFAREPERLRFTDGEYLAHEPWVRPAMDALGNVAGRRALDWGCGHGMAAVVLARRGATVSACDLSLEYTREASRRAQANGVRVRCVQADAHRLPFADAAFDAVWGHAILHHLDIVSAACELRRVLAPAGVAVLCEPWDGNPLVRWARRCRWPGAKAHTADERALTPLDVCKLRDTFDSVEMRGFQLMSVLHSAAPMAPGRRWAQRGDARLLQRWPALQKFGRYVVLILRRNPAGLSQQASAVR